MTTTPAGWYAHPDDPAYEFYWDGAAWTGDSRPTGTLVPSPLPAPAATETVARRIRPLWIGVGAGALLLVVAAAVAVLVLAQPRYPDSSPLTRDDLAAIATNLGVPTDARTGDSAILLGSSPSECGIVAQFGTGLWSQNDVDTGQPFYQVWGYGTAAGAPWVNARLFPTPADAAAFVDEVESAAGQCSAFTRPDDPTEWHDRNATRVGDLVMFEFDSTYAVVTAKDNAVFLFLFDGGSPDLDYVHSALG